MKGTVITNATSADTLAEQERDIICGDFVKGEINMKVILKSDVNKLGKAGSLIDVSDGHPKVSPLKQLPESSPNGKMNKPVRKPKTKRTVNQHSKHKRHCRVNQ